MKKIILVAVFGLMLVAGAYFMGVIPQLYADPYYPAPIGDKVYLPVTGHLKCESYGAEKPDGWTVYPQWEIPWLLNYYSAKATCTYKAGCRIPADPIIHCPPLALYSDSWVGVGNTKYTLPETIGYGTELTIAGRCWYWSPIGIINLKPDSIELTYYGQESGVYAYTEGYGFSGYVPNSKPNCNLIYADLTQLTRYQKEGDSIPRQELNLGETIPLLVGWREDPVFGNIGPYQGRNVYCRYGFGLYELDKVATIGGHDYWAAGEFITNNIDGKPVCCRNDECRIYGAEWVCEDHVCKKGGEVCEFGSCPWGSDIECGSPEECVRRDSEFYLIKRGCVKETRCCHQSEEKVMCCQSECDAMSTPERKYICDYSKGCVLISIKQECGAGRCCNVPPLTTDTALSPYKTQYCAIGECCPIQGESFRGYCSDVGCGDPPPPPPDDCWSQCMIKVFGILEMPDLVCFIECELEKATKSIMYLAKLVFVGLTFFIVLNVALKEQGKRNKRKGGKKQDNGEMWMIALALATLAGVVVYMII